MTAMLKKMKLENQHDETIDSSPKKVFKIILQYVDIETPKI
jgi:hypothetical protein